MRPRNNNDNNNNNNNNNDNNNNKPDVDAELERIKRLVSSAGPYPVVVKVAQRVFQRVPYIVTELLGEMETVPDSRRKEEMVSRIMGKIKEFVRDPQAAKELFMPSKTNEYH